MISTQFLIVSLTSISILQNHQYFFFQSNITTNFFMFIFSDLLKIIHILFSSRVISSSSSTILWLSIQFLIVSFSSVSMLQSRRFFPSRVISSPTSPCSSSATLIRSFIFLNNIIVNFFIFFFCNIFKIVSIFFLE